MAQALLCKGVEHPRAKERSMQLFKTTPMPRRDVPPLDLQQPADVRTATFALG
jgi:hypothetical protein